MNAIFEIIAKVLTIITSIMKGDQPKRSEVEQATSGLEKEDKNLQKELEAEIAKKEHDKKI